MIVAMAGLPGAGKSTLACAIATRLHAVVLDKDRIRAGLFPPSHAHYTDDRAAVVILDGCTHTRANQIATLRQTAADLAEPLRIVFHDNFRIVLSVAEVPHAAT